MVIALGSFGWVGYWLAGLTGMLVAVGLIGARYMYLILAAGKENASE